MSRPQTVSDLLIFGLLQLCTVIAHVLQTVLPAIFGLLRLNSKRSRPQTVCALFLTKITLVSKHPRPQTVCAVVGSVTLHAILIWVTETMDKLRHSVLVQRFIKNI